MKPALASSEAAVLYTVSFTLTLPSSPASRTTGAARSVDFLDREEAEAFARVLTRGSCEEGGEELVSAVEVHEEELFAPTTP